MGTLNSQRPTWVLLTLMLFSLISLPGVAAANLQSSESGWQATGVYLPEG